MLPLNNPWVGTRGILATVDALPPPRCADKLQCNQHPTFLDDLVTKVIKLSVVVATTILAASLLTDTDHPMPIHDFAQQNNKGPLTTLFQQKLNPFDLLPHQEDSLLISPYFWELVAGTCYNYGLPQQIMGYFLIDPPPKKITFSAKLPKKPLSAEKFQRVEKWTQFYSSDAGQKQPNPKVSFTKEVKVSYYQILEEPYKLYRTRDRAENSGVLGGSRFVKINPEPPKRTRPRKRRK